jgi:hypothetical protein
MLSISKAYNSKTPSNSNDLPKLNPNQLDNPKEKTINDKFHVTSIQQLNRMVQMKKKNTQGLNGFFAILTENLKIFLLFKKGLSLERR